MTPDPTVVGRRLEAALSGVAGAFRGMTAHRQESNCACHWGSAEELELLKAPDAPLDDDLLRRAYWTTDWRYPGPLLRRILPQLTQALVAGHVEPMAGMASLGHLFTVGRWQEWPAGQQDALREFLDAWWLHVLVEPDAKVPAHEAITLLAEVTAKLTPWMTTWAQLLANTTARLRLVTAADAWMDDLLGDRLPWASCHDEDTWCPTLSLWVLRHTPAALREHDTSAELHHYVRLLALPYADRWDR
ncbi:hypothetical protein [Micromonospora auratinigra]|uniref:Uncharacterized protein n=1 Tax=Micromonospora auratinigra TaxID=261654 RepID=A0A1A8Z9Y4_9ACTN|nr:hypothetical protein [Micromonospora auratinigra]SBT40777.1 hypothetical protein GA0070611_1389 [Micromonospora auratinigra]